VYGTAVVSDWFLEDIPQCISKLFAKNKQQPVKMVKPSGRFNGFIFSSNLINARSYITWIE
ncbi:MAG: hypothetical protein ACK55T_01590, partial [Bacteroidota bacterium]